MGRDCEILYKEVKGSIPLGALCQVEFACLPFDSVCPPKTSNIGGLWKQAKIQGYMSA